MYINASGPTCSLLWGTGPFLVSLWSWPPLLQLGYLLQALGVAEVQVEVQAGDLSNLRGRPIKDVEGAF